MRRSCNSVRGGDARGVGGHAVERVRGRVVGLVALAVPAVVEGDHPVPRRERVEVVGEVLLRAADAVQRGAARAPPDRPVATVARPTPSSVVTRIASIYGRREQPVNEPVT